MINRDRQGSIDEHCCESLRLIELEGEYTVFLVRTETEISLLKHLKECNDCREPLQIFVKGEDNTFLSRLVPFLQSVELNPDEVKEKIDARINHLEGIFGDALEELKGLQESIKSIQQ
jgi:hypothetical protein